MRFLLSAVLALATTWAQGDVYKCTGADGRINFTDAPCGAGTAKAESVVIPPHPETYLEKIEREHAEASAAHEKTMAEINARSAERERRIRARNLGRKMHEGLVIGMTMDAVLELPAWGNPDDTNSTQTAAGKREQWIYETDEENEFERMYLYFQNGILAVIQD